MGAVRVTYLLRMAKKISGSSFEPNNLTEQKLGVVRVVKSENDLEKEPRTIS